MEMLARPDDGAPGEIGGFEGPFGRGLPQGFPGIPWGAQNPPFLLPKRKPAHKRDEKGQENA